jgi:hypothetical protein
MDRGLPARLPSTGNIDGGVQMKIQKKAMKNKNF